MIGTLFRIRAWWLGYRANDAMADFVRHSSQGEIGSSYAATTLAYIADLDSQRRALEARIIERKP